jgi:hypothetical protein
MVPHKLAVNMLVTRAEEEQLVVQEKWRVKQYIFEHRVKRWENEGSGGVSVRIQEV